MDNTTEKVKCPICDWYLFNKTSNASGYIEIKCKRCKKIVKIKLNKE